MNIKIVIVVNSTHSNIVIFNSINVIISISSSGDSGEVKINVWFLPPDTLELLPLKPLVTTFQLETFLTSSVITD